MSDTTTVKGTKPGLIAAAAAAVVIVLVFGNHLMQKAKRGDEVSVDFVAHWTPQRRVDVHWQVGPNITGERFHPDDRGEFSYRTVANRGLQLVIVAEQPGGPGALSCEIWVDDELVGADEVSGKDTCRVAVIA